MPTTGTYISAEDIHDAPPGIAVLTRQPNFNPRNPAQPLPPALDQQRTILEELEAIAEAHVIWQPYYNPQTRQITEYRPVLPAGAHESILTQQAAMLGSVINDLRMYRMQAVAAAKTVQHVGRYKFMLGFASFCNLAGAFFVPLMVHIGAGADLENQYQTKMKPAAEARIDELSGRSPYLSPEQRSVVFANLRRQGRVALIKANPGKGYEAKALAYRQLPLLPIPFWSWIMMVVHNPLFTPVYKLGIEMKLRDDERDLFRMYNRRVQELHARRAQIPAYH